MCQGATSARVPRQECHECQGAKMPHGPELGYNSPFVRPRLARMYSEINGLTPIYASGVRFIDGETLRNLRKGPGCRA
jgi:hypothetical protein